MRAKGTHRITRFDRFTIVVSRHRHRQRRRRGAQLEEPGRLGGDQRAGKRRPRDQTRRSDLRRRSVLTREVECERAPGARDAHDADLPAEQAGNLATDRQPEPGPSVAAARRAVGLLEGFENDALLFFGDPDARVRHAERDDGVGLVQDLVAAAPAVARELHFHRDVTVLGELEGVRK
jgi:hypothetical protein